MGHIDHVAYISPYTIIPSRLFVFNLSSWDAIFPQIELFSDNALSLVLFLSVLFFLCRT